MIQQQQPLLKLQSKTNDFDAMIVIEITRGILML